MKMLFVSVIVAFTSICFATDASQPSKNCIRTLAADFPSLLTQNILKVADEREKPILQSIGLGFLEIGSLISGPNISLDSRVFEGARYLELSDTPSQEIKDLVIRRLDSHLFLPTTDELGFISGTPSLRSLAESIASGSTKANFSDQWLLRARDIYRKYVRRQNYTGGRTSNYKVWLGHVALMSLRYDLDGFVEKAAGLAFSLGQFDEFVKLSSQVSTIASINSKSFKSRDDLLFIAGHFALADYFYGVVTGKIYRQSSLDAGIQAFGAIEGRYRNYSRNLLRDLHYELGKEGHKKIIQNIHVNGDQGALFRAHLRSLRYSGKRRFPFMTFENGSFDLVTSLRDVPRSTEDLQAIMAGTNFRTETKVEVAKLYMALTGEPTSSIARFDSQVAEILLKPKSRSAQGDEKGVQAQIDLLKAIQKGQSPVQSIFNEMEIEELTALDPNEITQMERSAFIYQLAANLEYEQLLRTAQIYSLEDPVTARSALIAAILVRESGRWRKLP